ncbi:MAG: twin-arginine translocase TatA/TatE family subunit [Acidimicrobiales bacterium]|nr:twin-arginine translocase TatA/TatE family subunit [Acidimicrobiales bacterium]
MEVGPGELLVILVIVFVFVGADRVPRLARSLGEAMREFNRTAADDPANRNAD